MPAGWVAAGTAVLGGLNQANASKSAGSQQAEAANTAAVLQRDQLNRASAQNRPYRQAGENAVSELQRYLGFGGNYSDTQRQDARQKLTYDIQHPELDPWWDTQAGKDYVAAGGVRGKRSSDWEAPTVDTYLQNNYTPEGGDEKYGTLLKPFDAQDLNQWQDPGYKFRLEQGNLGVTNSAAARGGLVGGNALKAISDYNQGAASQEYQNAFGRYNTNQSNIYNRLSQLAGLGQTAASNAQTGASQFTGQIGENVTGAGNARAAGTVGSANAIAGGLNNAASWFV